VEIYGVGRLIEWGEWWRLIYYRCGHETRFVRSAQQLFDIDAERLVIANYAECTLCHPRRRAA